MDGRPSCCEKLGFAVEMKEEGRDVVATGAVESWVMLWRLGRRVVMWWPWCCGELGGAVEMMEGGCDVVALVLWRAGWCCGGKDGRS